MLNYKVEIAYHTGPGAVIAMFNHPSDARDFMVHKAGVITEAFHLILIGPEGNAIEAVAGQRKGDPLMAS